MYASRRPIGIRTGPEEGMGRVVVPEGDFKRFFAEGLPDTRPGVFLAFFESGFFPCFIIVARFEERVVPGTVDAIVEPSGRYRGCSREREHRPEAGGFSSVYVGEEGPCRWATVRSGSRSCDKTVES